MWGRVFYLGLRLLAVNYVWSVNGTSVTSSGSMYFSQACYSDTPWGVNLIHFPPFSYERIWGKQYTHTGFLVHMPAKTLGSVVQQGEGSHVSLSETEKKPHESFATLTASWVELKDQCQSAAVQEEALNVFFKLFQWVLWSHAVFAYWIKRRWLLSSSWEGLRDRTYCISLHFVCFDIKILSLCV